MVRFLHTADWQFGMKAKDVAAMGGDIRRVRLETLARTGRIAADKGAQFVLLAGDVFEDNQVDNQLVYDVLRCLERFECPVYLLPGNHDHAGPGSVWSRPAFAHRAGHVHLLLEAVPLLLGEAALLPAPLFSRTSSDDPTEALACMETPPGAVRIGVAHGSMRIEGKYQPDDFPIALAAASCSRLDYLALGHWHSWYQHDARTVYSGTPEQTKFGERDSGTAAFVEIDFPRAEPRVERLAIGQLTWESWEERVGDPDGLLARWRERIAQLAEPQHVLLRLRPSGRVPADFLGRLADLAAWARARLYYLDVRDDELAPSLDLGVLADHGAAHPLIGGLLADLAATGALLEPAPGDPPPVFGALEPEFLRAQLAELGGDAGLVREAGKLLAELTQEVLA